MCGIVGYMGSEQAQPILLEGLSRLAYRGYDSAGLAVMDAGQIRLTKAKGKLANLQSRVQAQPLPGTAGIGHTRWATHGEPSDLNAHPHTDMTGDIALVHNGIIENHDRLRTMLEEAGCVFASQTDTEVIAHLLHTLWDGSMLSTLRRALPLLEGSYALCVLCRKEPDVLFCTRKDSPLVIGLADTANYVASDVPALLPYTRQVEYLQDKEIALVARNDVRIVSPLGQERPLSPKEIAWNMEEAEKSGYAHFMLKEIHEQPQALRKTFSAHVNETQMELRRELFTLSAKDARAAKTLYIVACGTACHAGLLGRTFFEQWANLPTQVETASEFRYRNPHLSPGDLCLCISQSGETADTLAALREAADRGAITLALTNVVGSSITREAQHTLFTCAGPEIAVASTKAYVTQVEMLALLALDLAQKRSCMDQAQVSGVLQKMAQLPELAAQTLLLEGQIRRFASLVCNRQQAFFIGRNMDYALALEASLKLKEVSYMMCEGCAAGEMKHGPIALIEPGTLVCAIITQGHVADKMLSNIREVKARGAKVLALCPESMKQKVIEHADELWLLPDADEMLLPMLAIMPLQLFAYYMAVHRACDVDQPRNLAKSVTVE